MIDAITLERAKPYFSSYLTALKAWRSALNDMADESLSSTKLLFKYNGKLYLRVSISNNYASDNSVTQNWLNDSFRSLVPKSKSFVLTGIASVRGKNMGRNRVLGVNMNYSPTQVVHDNIHSAIPVFCTHGQKYDNWGKWAKTISAADLDQYLSDLSGGCTYGLFAGTTISDNSWKDRVKLLSNVHRTALPSASSVRSCYFKPRDNWKSAIDRTPPRVRCLEAIKANLLDQDLGVVVPIGVRLLSYNGATSTSFNLGGTIASMILNPASMLGANCATFDKTQEYWNGDYANFISTLSSIAESRIAIPLNEDADVWQSGDGDEAIVLPYIVASNVGMSAIRPQFSVGPVGVLCPDFAVPPDDIVKLVKKFEIEDVCAVLSELGYSSVKMVCGYDAQCVAYDYMHEGETPGANKLLDWLDDLIGKWRSTIFDAANIESIKRMWASIVTQQLSVAQLSDVALFSTGQVVLSANALRAISARSNSVSYGLTLQQKEIADVRPLNNLTSKFNVISEDEL